MLRFSLLPQGVSAQGVEANNSNNQANRNLVRLSSGFPGMERFFCDFARIPKDRALPVRFFLNFRVWGTSFEVLSGFPWMVCFL